jgi:hypothetical protein
MPSEPHGQAAGSPGEPAIRWSEVDLSHLALSADLATPDQLATAAAHLYERFVPYADEGWEWLHHPGGRDFDGWLFALRDGRPILAGARLASRCVAPSEPTGARPAHGLSAYRTNQLTGRPWTAEPGSKRWHPFNHPLDPP